MLTCFRAGCVCKCCFSSTAAAAAASEFRHRLAPGGDILHRMNRQNCGHFTLPIARFVIAQVILALECAPPPPPQPTHVVSL
jgi:hypothetical protein